MRYVIDNRPEPIDFEAGGDMVTRTIKNAKNLMMTRMGEVPFDRLRGLDPALDHLPMDKLRAALLPELDRVMAWEPDAEVVSATATRMTDGDTVIKVVIEVRE